MNRIAYEDTKENELITTIDAFFRNCELSKLLRRSNVYKEKGIQPVLLFHKLFELLFLHRSLFEELKRSDLCAKDTFYRFLNSTSINWLNFTTVLAAKIVTCFLERLTSKERVNVFIIDDTIYEKQHCRKAELLARVYDHAHNKYTWGFRLLTLCWSDGNSVVPVNSALLSSAKERKLDVIAAVKKGEKSHYLYNGVQMSLNKIYSLNKKRGGRSRKNDYLVLLSTDTKLPENEIIRLYGKRWGIEVFFKTAKSCLKLGKECHALSYDAMTAYVAVVFARYNMLTYLNRSEEDQRSIGELFYAVYDELPDISLAEAFRKLLSCFEEILSGTSVFSKKEISKMMDKLISSLPQVIQIRLGVCL